MTITEFNKAFKPFLDYFPTENMSEEKLNIYCLALSNLTVEQLNNAFISMVRDRVYKSFPQVAEIITYAMGTNEKHINSRIVIAKEQLKRAIAKFGAYQSVQFEDLGIHAIIDSLGGWQKLCQLSEEEFKKFLTFEFSKIYEVYVRTPYNVNKHYIGYFDQANNELNINYIAINGNTKLLIENKKVESLENKAGELVTFDIKNLRSLIN